jgi:hypothetical protein
MARHMTLQHIFKSSCKEEMHIHVDREFESLGKRLELEKALKKEAMKWSVGRLKKELHVVCWIPMKVTCIIL